MSAVETPVAMLAPHSVEAESSVVGVMLANPKVIGEVVGTLLEAEHFYLPAFKALFRAIVDAYYADEPTDALTIGELQAKTLARTWRSDEDEAVRTVVELAAGRKPFAANAIAHARLVKRDADFRALLDLAKAIERSVQLETDAPDEIAGLASQNAMRIATSTLLTHELVAFDDLGKRFVEDQRLQMRARAAGVELGAYFGLQFVDDYTRGLRPTELMVLAGEPGAGKSAVAWRCAHNFAERQMTRSLEERIGTLVLSLEMGEEQSNVRLAQTIGGVDGGRMREGKLEEKDLQRIMREWEGLKGLPLYFNFTSTLRGSQLRALVVEAIRRHNVGFVVLDHMRYFDMDGRWDSQLEHDEAKSRFLKEDIAKELNVAVLCLAHTTKGLDSDDKRPKLSNLRGSGQIAADADFVAFIYRPYLHATQKKIEEGKVLRTDAELIFAKNRWGLDGSVPFYFDPSTMAVADSVLFTPNEDGGF